jgi:hypothetical protein
MHLRCTILTGRFPSLAGGIAGPAVNCGNPAMTARCPASRKTATDACGFTAIGTLTMPMSGTSGALTAQFFGEAGTG